MTTRSINGWQAVLVVVLYVAGAAWAALTVRSPDQVTIIWPPAGIAFATLLIWGVRSVWVIALALTLYHFVFSETPAAFYPFSLLANTVAMVVGVAYVLRRSPHAADSLSARSGFFMLQGAVIAVILSALIGVPGLVVAKMVPLDRLLDSLLIWIGSDIFGVICLTPPLIVLHHTMQGKFIPFPGFPYAKASERWFWLSLFLLSLGLMAAFGSESGHYALGLTALPMSLVVWAALRFEPVWAMMSLTLLGLLFTTLAGLGLLGFSPPTQTLQSLMLVTFMSLAMITPQLVTAVHFENRLSAYRLIKRLNTDRLTGLMNRNAFENEVRELTRKHGSESMALAYLDLDQFKLINDTASHEAGDALIRSIVGVLKSKLQHNDVLARLGGDEFVMLLRQDEHVSPAKRATELLHAVSQFRFQWEGQVIAPTASLGLVPFKAGQTPFASLLSQADAACFAAKELGGNRVQTSSPDHSDQQARNTAMRWAMRLNEALDHGHFRLYCQSIVPLRGDNNLRHCEVLLRMVDQSSGDVLTPGPYIAAAERFKLGERLDRAVVGKVFDWFDSNPEAVSQLELCSINLSGAAVSDEHFLQYLEQRLAACKTPASRFCFEITETSAVRDLANAQRFIQRMRHLGCKLALDDFGAGFCSFAYLQSLDVDYFKIDGSFVRDVQHSPLSLSIVKSIAEIARVMRKHTVAEYTESESIRAELAKLGVDYAQGFAIDHPMPIETYFNRPTEPARNAA